MEAVPTKRMMRKITSGSPFLLIFAKWVRLPSTKKTNQRNVSQLISRSCICSPISKTPKTGNLLLLLLLPSSSLPLQERCESGRDKMGTDTTSGGNYSKKSGGKLRIGAGASLRRNPPACGHVLNVKLH